MCGIVGMFGDLDGKADKPFRLMLIMDSIRGEDSTGVATVHKFMPEVNVVKQLGNPFELFGMKQYENAISKINKAIIGHNRFATSGGVTKATAHPFDMGNIVGVHNGTLTNKHQLDDAAMFKVDSENLYHCIQKNGLHETIEETQGAWALAWWNRENQTMNFLRNKERPLHYAIGEGGKQIYYASEQWMLIAALNRYEVKYDSISAFETDTHYEIEIEKGGKIGKPVLTDCKEKERAVVVHYPSFTTGTRGSTNSTTGGIAQKNGDSGTVGSVAPQTVTKAASSKVVNYPNSRWNLDYVNQKGNVYEAVCTMSDKHGAEYVLCFDAEKPAYEVRLYRSNHNDIHNQLGCEFEADVGGFMLTESNIGFYKLSPHNIKIVEAAPPDVADLYEPLEQGDDSNKFLSNDGKYLSRAQWIAKHGECCFCGDVFDPEHISRGAKLTRDGDGLCISCASDTSLNQYVQFV